VKALWAGTDVKRQNSKEIMAIRGRETDILGDPSLIEEEGCKIEGMPTCSVRQGCRAKSG